MAPWLLLCLAGVFAYLAFDAARIVAPRNDQAFPPDMRPPLIEEPSAKTYRLINGFGDLNQSVWLFVILSGTFAICSLWAFFP